MRKIQTVKDKDALMRILFKVTRMLFYGLANKISTDRQCFLSLPINYGKYLHDRCQ
jgi:hypothetical protein